MPRIDPLKLLTCLKVLLAPNGGIKSENEVKRLAGLMAKYSKKLVSKCIYIQILKCTKTDLLEAFMASGGWSLTHMWLTDGIRAMNWPLVQEILELLLLCPVDIPRLRSNSAPKLVKGLCKDGGNESVRLLASKLVEQWLKVVKGETMAITTTSGATTENVAGTVGKVSGIDSHTSEVGGLENRISESSNVMAEETNASEYPDGSSPGTDHNMGGSLSSSEKTNSGLVYKFVFKDGKQVLAKIDSNSSTSNDTEMLLDKDGKSSSSENEIPNLDEGDAKGSLEGGAVQSDNKENEKNKDSESKSKESKDKEIVNEHKEKDKSRSSSSSGNGKEKSKHREHKSSSHHRSSSSKSSKSSSTSSSSKSKSSSSTSSSSHKSSSDSKSKEKDRESDRDKSKHRSSSKSSSSSSSSSKDKHRDRDKEKARQDKEKEKEKSREKEKEKDNKDKELTDKEKIEFSIKNLSPSLEKLGKIPKKKDISDSNSNASPTATSITIPSKKASMSIEIRPSTEKPKTVKTYNSQFRSHGLAEEAPPPPSRKGLKKPPSQPIPGTAIFSTVSFKRSSPPPSSSTSGGSSGSLSKDGSGGPPEKKVKIDLNPSATANEKPGGIKLIAPKAKPPTLVESDMFMDALSASVCVKKDSRKRKRRPSNSNSSSIKDSTSPPESPVGTKVTPLKFYQDTLEDKDEEKNENSEDNKENREDGERKDDEDDIPLKRVKERIEEEVQKEKEDESNKDEDEKDDVEDEEVTKKPPGPGCGPNGPPGVLMLHRRKGPKKKLTWKQEEELESIRYFELDETERVNVTKTFTDMKQMERFNERDAFILARKLNSEDIMCEQTQWVPLILVDDVPPHPEGSQSKEKKIQAEREQTTLKALYFTRHMIPDSPAEPDMEQYQITEPAVIPLDDITGNPDAINDFTNMPWPDPKGSPPPQGMHDEFLGGSDMGFNGGQFNPFMQFGQSPWQMGAPGNPVAGSNLAGPNGVIPNMLGPGIVGGPNMGGPGVGGPNMGGMAGPGIGGAPLIGPGIGAFNNMNMGPNMGGPPAMLVGQDNIMSPFGNGPNFGQPTGPAFNNFATGPQGININPNMNANRNMDNRGNSNRGNWRSGNSGGLQSRDSNSGNWRQQGPAGAGGGGSGGNSGNNRGGGWVHGSSNRICRQFQRGHCRNGNKCNYLHPGKNY